MARHAKATSLSTSPRRSRYLKVSAVHSQQQQQNGVPPRLGPARARGRYRPVHPAPARYIHPCVLGCCRRESLVFSLDQSLMLFLLDPYARPLSAPISCDWIDALCCVLMDAGRLDGPAGLYTTQRLGHRSLRMRRRTAPLSPSHGSDNVFHNLSQPCLRSPPRSNCFAQQAVAFLVSYATHTVLLPLEIFTAAFVVLCLVSPASLGPGPDKLTTRPSVPRGRT